MTLPFVKFLFRLARFLGLLSMRVKGKTVTNPSRMTIPIETISGVVDSYDNDSYFRAPAAICTAVVYFPVPFQKSS